MYKASMSQELVKKKADVPVDLTEMQRRFVDYLVYNEGRTTHTDAALKAGYAPKSATQEASRLMRNPKVQAYYQKKSNEVNRAFTVTKGNYVRRQQVLSQKLVDEGKIDKALGFENLIGKATGQFIETHIHGNLNDLSKQEKLDEIKRLKTLQEERLKITKG
jgi:phage terminase small subunit|tara:strand:- start:759 stop:1244 length:486 start_codon:yes stop_codon:yes gene_type:complete